MAKKLLSAILCTVLCFAMPTVISAKAAMKAGDFYTKNNGSSIESNIEGFVESAYDSTTDITYMNYLWGEWDDVELTHPGVDMHSTKGTPKIKATHAGVVTTDQTNRVGIYDASEGVTYFYLHLTNIIKRKVGSTVNVGDELGTQGSHLHFEIDSGKTKYMQYAKKIVLNH